MIDATTLATQLDHLLRDALVPLIATLDPQAALSHQETQVREWLAQIGQQTLTQMVAWQSQQETARPPCPQCHRPCTWQGMRSTTLHTLLGQIPLTRRYAYCAACQEGVCPLDTVLGIHGTRTSLGVQREASYLSALLTYAETAATLERSYPLTISPWQVETLTLPVGQALQQDADQQAQTVLQTPVPPVAPAGRQYVSMDGIFARVRRDATDLTPTEADQAGDVYREVKVATVFTATPGQDRSQLVPAIRPDTVTQTWYHARRTTADEFGPQVYAAAVQPTGTLPQEVVVLGDGAPWIWRLAEEHFPDATQIVDVWHAQQYLWDVARTVFGPEAALGRQWATHTTDLLLHGQMDEVVARLQALTDLPLPPGVLTRTPTTALTYFTTHAARMRYPEFRARGLLIGSGPAEAGCKSVVTTRFKRAGMRWSLVGLDALLPIRTAVLNGAFDAWWLTQHHTLVA